MYYLRSLIVNLERIFGSFRRNLLADFEKSLIANLERIFGSSRRKLLPDLEKKPYSEFRKNFWFL